MKIELYLEDDENPDLSGRDRLLCRIWLLLDDPGSSKPAKWVSIFVMFTILLSICGMTFASIPENIHWTDVYSDIATGNVIEGSRTGNGTPAGAFLSYGPRQVCDKLDESRPPFRQIEVFCITVFTTEYVLRAISSPAAVGYCRYFLGAANIVDLVSIIPFYIELVMKLSGGDGGSSLGVLSVLRLIRLTRIARMFKMSKNFQGLLILAKTFKSSAAALIMLFLFMLIFSVLFATLIYTVEGGSYDEKRRQYVRADGSASPFESIPVAIWWTIVTMCTVGYGDQYPVTPVGKMVAIMTMFSGLIVLSLPITIIGSTFNVEYQNALLKEQRKADDLRRETERDSITETGKPGTDAITMIHDLIDQSHKNLKQETLKAILRHENKLRFEIKRVLAEHNAEIKQDSPLDEERIYEILFPQAGGPKKAVFCRSPAAS